MSADRAQRDRLRADRGRLVQALVDAGAEVRGNSVRCPFHPDHKASGAIFKTDGAWRFKCHACPAKGDVFAVVQRAARVDFKGALALLGVNGNGGATAATARESGPPARAPGPPRTPERKEPAPSGLAAECAARLTDDDDALQRLWETRAIDQATAKRFAVGVSAGVRYWTFPVAGAVKHHRIDPHGDGPKCFWTPKGASSRNVWPVCLDAGGPVWLCPGELKALAVAATGRAAVGITAGESADLPDGLPEMLSGRAVAIAADDDDAGRRWAIKARDALAAAGLDVRIVDYGADAAAALKDVGDVLAAQILDGKEATERAAYLDFAYERSDPWAGYTIGTILADSRTWAPVEHVPTGWYALDAALGGGLRCGGVCLIGGPSARGKTQLVTGLAVNVARRKVPVGFVSIEMATRDIAHVIAAATADVHRAWLNTGNLRGDAAQRLRDVARDAASWPLTVLDESFWRGPLARSHLARIVARGARSGWRVLIIDYLGLIAAERDDRSDYAAECETSGALKRLAQEHNLATVVLADLRKAATYQKKKERSNVITLDDFRGAARLTYDATSVFYLDSEQASNGHGAEPTGLIKLTALKTRFAAAGSRRDEVQLRWYPATGRIVDLEGLTAGEM